MDTNQFQLSLPAAWKDDSDKDSFAYFNPETSEELVISTGEITKPVDGKLLADIVWRLLQHKASALGQLSSGNFTVLSGTQPIPSIPTSGALTGFDSKNQTYTKTLITSNAKSFVSITYYQHKCSLPSPQTESRATSIINMCHVK